MPPGKAWNEFQAKHRSSHRHQACKEKKGKGAGEGVPFHPKREIQESENKPRLENKQINKQINHGFQIK